MNAESESGRQYHLSLNILVDAVQATPAEAAQETWGVTVSNGTIIKDSENVNLTAISGSPLN